MIEGEAPEPSSEVRKVPTQRQMEVLRLLAQGLTDDEVARALGLSRQSVKNHKTELFRRMKVHSKVEAFIVMGWLRLP